MVPTERSRTVRHEFTVYREHRVPGPVEGQVAGTAQHPIPDAVIRGSLLTAPDRIARIERVSNDGYFRMKSTTLPRSGFNNRPLEESE